MIGNTQDAGNNTSLCIEEQGLDQVRFRDDSATSDSDHLKLLRKLHKRPKKQQMPPLPRNMKN